MRSYICDKMIFIRKNKSKGIIDIKPEECVLWRKIVRNLETLPPKYQQFSLSELINYSFFTCLFLLTTSAPSSKSLFQYFLLLTSVFHVRGFLEQLVILAAISRIKLRHDKPGWKLSRNGHDLLSGGSHGGVDSCRAVISFGSLSLLLD